MNGYELISLILGYEIWEVEEVKKNIEDKTHRFHIVLLWVEEYAEKLAQLTLKVIFYEILTFIQLHLHVHVTDMVNNVYHRTLTLTLHNTLLILKTVT